MAVYEQGDYIKVEFKDDSTGESEWMWVMVDHAGQKEIYADYVIGELHCGR